MSEKKKKKKKKLGNTIEGGQNKKTKQTNKKNKTKQNTKNKTKSHILFSIKAKSGIWSTEVTKLSTH